jgi:branched-chain amino acid aminotransferase
MAARGSQVFDVLLAVDTEDGYSGIGLREHVVRFCRSAEMMGMEQRWSPGEIEAAIAATVAANFGPLALDDGQPTRNTLVIKIIAAWVEDAMGLMPARLEPTTYVTAWAKDGSDPAQALMKPAAVKSSSIPKIPAELLPPSLKVAAGYTPGFRAHLAAEAEGFDQVVFKTLSGDLAESTTSSLLLVSGGRVIAPPLDTVLDGITRRLVLDAAQSLELPVDVRAVRWDEVTAADELFLSSTNQPVVPVHRLDDRSLDAPGPITTRLAEETAEIYHGRHRLSARWLTPLAKLA